VPACEPRPVRPSSACAARRRMPRRRERGRQAEAALAGVRVVLFSAQAAALQPRAGRARRSLFETPARLSDGRMTNLRISLPPGFPAARPSLAVTHPLMHAWVRPVPRRRVRSSWRSRWWVGRLSACPTLPARTGRWGRLHAPARQQASHTPCDASRVDRSAYSPALFLEPAVSLQASPWLSVESGAGRRGRAAGDAWAARLGARRAPGAGGHRGAGRAGGRARAVARGRPCAPRQRGLLRRALGGPREGPARISSVVEEPGSGCLVLESREERVLASVAMAHPAAHQWRRCGVTAAHSCGSARRGWPPLRARPQASVPHWPIAKRQCPKRR